MSLPAPTAFSTARRMLSMLAASYGRWRLLSMLGLGLAASLAEGAGLVMLAPVLTLVGVGGEGPREAGPLLLGLGLYLLLVAAAAGVTAARTIIVNDQCGRFVDGLRADLHAALLHVSWPVFQSLRSTDVKQILTTEVNRLGVCHDAMVNLGVSALALPTLLVAAFMLSPSLTLATLGASLLSLLLIRRIGRSGFEIGLRLGRAHQAVMADLTDDLAGLRIIKALGAEQRRQDVLLRQFTDLRQLQARHAKIRAFEQASLVLAAAALAALAVAAATLWLRQDLSASLVVVLAFARLAQRGLGSMRVWRQLESGLPGVILYDEMLARLRAGAEPETPSAALPQFSHALTLRGVGLRMHDGRQALDGVDLDLPFGVLLAVTGPSGAGKSTLTDIVAGLVPPTSGTMAVDGTNLAPGHLPVWRRQVAIVPQDPFLFHSSIRDNLLLAAPTATEPDLWAALEDAAAAAFVRALPHGLDTVVGDRGGAVSGGERQRLAIARALLRRPRLLILDEATSALDAGSEALILQCLDRLRGRITVLAVTHREATRRSADCILELAAGRVQSVVDIKGQDF